MADACLQLLEAGEAGFGPVDVARVSGVSRATLHRWWPAKADLLREALTEHTSTLAVRDTGVWRDDLFAFVHQLAPFFADPVEVGLNALMASGEHADFTEAVLDRYESIFAEWRALVERARDRGEVRADAEVDAVLLTLVSPLVVVPLVFRVPLSTHDVDAVATLVHQATATH